MTKPPAQLSAMTLTIPPLSIGGRSRRLILLGSVTTILAAALGWLACVEVGRLGLAERETGGTSIFFFLYYTYERPHFLIVGLFALAVLLWALTRYEDRPNAAATLSWGQAAAGILFIAIIASVVTGAGTLLICHNYAFSMDEFAATFQARIFARGQVEAKLPEPWRRFAFALSPIFIMVDRKHGTWTSGYLPIYAGIRALFLRAGSEPWTNPVLAGGAVLMIGAISRRLWPAKPHYALIAAVLLVTSPQFLLTSMTAYAMPAHLFFNLLWLLLYLRGSPKTLAVAPWVGVLAMGLNNPLPHALFAAPFLLRLLRSQRWGWAGYFAGVYAGGFAGWWIWLTGISPYWRGTSALSQFSFPVGQQDWLQQLMHSTLLFSWLSPVVALLVVVGLASWKEWREPVRDLALGAGATIGLYSLYYTGQGHGWGYRYIYGVLGNIVLLAMCGFMVLEQSRWRGRAGLIVASAAVAVALELPLRAREAGEAIRPFEHAASFIQSFRGSVVAVDTSLGWYLQDLVRNEPFLANDPKIVFADRLRPKQAQLELLFPGRIHELTKEELMRLGFPTFRRSPHRRR